MLKKITSSIKNIGSKSLIIIIALSFAVWGIGDIFTGDSNPTIATVGNSKIKLNDFNLEYQTIVDNLRQNNSEPISEEFIKSLGIHKSVLNNIINNEYINQLSKSLGIIASENYIKKTIFQNKSFHDQLGVFNKDYFNYFLNRNNISESEVLAISEKNLISNVFIKTIGSSLSTSKMLANNLKNKRDIARKAEIYEINTSSVIIKREITEDEILNHYNKIKQSLLKPEKRNINIIIVSKNDIDQTYNVKEDEALNVYNANKNTYQIPEKREVLQFIFDTKEKADEFILKIKNSSDINAYIKNQNIDLNDVSLGLVSKDDLEEDINEISFSLKEKSFSLPIKSSFGWKVLFIKKVISKNNITFDQAKDKIKREIKDDVINERVYKKANLFYEKFLETKDLNLSLQYSKLSKKTFNEIMINDIKNLETETLNVSEDELIKLIFNLGEGTISDPIEKNKNDLFFIYLDKIIKPSPKTLQEARGEVVKNIYYKIKKEKAINTAKKVRDSLIKGNKIDTQLYTLIKTDWVTNDNRLDKKIDKKIKNIIFSTKLNEISKVRELADFKYFFVKPMAQNNKVLDEDKVSNVDNILFNLDTNIDNDILNALLLDLKSEKKSSINQNFINSF